jgi:hypothetical protein
MSPTQSSRVTPSVDDIEFFVVHSNVKHYEALMSEMTDTKQRSIVSKLLVAELAKLLLMMAKRGSGDLSNEHVEIVSAAEEQSSQSNLCGRHT